MDPAGCHKISCCMRGNLCASTLELELQRHGRGQSMLRLVVRAKQAPGCLPADPQWGFVSDGAFLTTLQCMGSKMLRFLEVSISSDRKLGRRLEMPKGSTGLHMSHHYQHTQPTLLMDDGNHVPNFLQFSASSRVSLAASPSTSGAERPSFCCQEGWCQHSQLASPRYPLRRRAATST